MNIFAGFLPSNAQTVQISNSQGKTMDDDYKILGIFGLMLSQQLLDAEGIKLDSEHLLSEKIIEEEFIPESFLGLVEVVKEYYPEIDSLKLKDIILKNIFSQDSLIEKNSINVDVGLEVSKHHNISLEQIVQLVEKNVKEVVSENIVNPPGFRDGILAFLNKDRVTIAEESLEELQDKEKSPDVESKIANNPEYKGFQEFKGMFYGKKNNTAEVKLLSPYNNNSKNMEILDQNQGGSITPIFSTMKLEGMASAEVINFCCIFSNSFFAEAKPSSYP